MICHRLSTRLVAVLLPVLLGACFGVTEPPAEPTFYRNLAASDEQVDAVVMVKRLVVVMT